MGKSYSRYYPEQDFLLPPSLREWLPENHLVYFVSDVVDNLNLTALDAVYGDEQRGQPPYDPRMLTKVLVYGYCVGCTARGASSGGWPRMWRFGCWQQVTRRTSGRSQTSASCAWRRWQDCLKRCCRSRWKRGR